MDNYKLCWGCTSPRKDRNCLKQFERCSYPTHRMEHPGVRGNPDFVSLSLLSKISVKAWPHLSCNPNVCDLGTVYRFLDCGTYRGMQPERATKAQFPKHPKYFSVSFCRHVNNKLIFCTTWYINLCSDFSY